MSVVDQSDNPRRVGSQWLHAGGDDSGTMRFWDGKQWIGGPVPASPDRYQQPPSAPAPGRFGRRATASIRVVARGIDTMFAGGLAILVGWLARPDELFQRSPSDVGAWAIVAISFVVVGLIADVAPTALAGRSLGKALSQLAVVADSGRYPIGPLRSLRRWLALHAVPLVLLPVLIEAAFVAATFILAISLYGMMNDPYRRTIGDRAARTSVVEVD